MSRFSSTLLKCVGCNALGAITWDLSYREAVQEPAQDRYFVRLAGDFHLDEVRLAGRRMIVCSQCDAIYGPVPDNSFPRADAAAQPIGRKPD